MENPGTSVSPTLLNLMRASLASGDNVEGRFESNNTPLPGILLWIRKGGVFGLVPSLGELIREPGCMHLKREN